MEIFACFISKHFAFRYLSGKEDHPAESRLKEIPGSTSYRKFYAN